MFTTNCCICKNTPELQMRLRKIGYNVLFSARGGYGNVLLAFGGFVKAEDVPHKNAIDCGTNETLFLALAALRDDSDYMQWFCDYRGENWVLCTERVYRGSREWHTERGILHKASVEEILKHFNNK